MKRAISAMTSAGLGVRNFRIMRAEFRAGHVSPAPGYKDNDPGKILSPDLEGAQSGKDGVQAAEGRARDREPLPGGSEGARCGDAECAPDEVREPERADRGRVALEGLHL